MQSRNSTTEMKAYLASQIPLAAGVFNGMSTPKLVESIDAIYEGGVKQWRHDYLGWPLEETSSEEADRLAVRAMFKDQFGIQLQQCEEVLGYDNDGKDWVFSIQVTITKSSFARDTEVARYLRLYKFPMWHYGRANLELIAQAEVEDFDGQVFAGQYSRLLTVEYWADKSEQDRLCSDPGDTSWLDPRHRAKSLDPMSGVRYVKSLDRLV